MKSYLTIVLALLIAYNSCAISMDSCNICSVGSGIGDLKSVQDGKFYYIAGTTTTTAGVNRVIVFKTDSNLNTIAERFYEDTFGRFGLNSMQVIDDRLFLVIEYYTIERDDYLTNEHSRLMIISKNNLDSVRFIHYDNYTPVAIIPDTLSTYIVLGTSVDSGGRAFRDRSFGRQSTIRICKTDKNLNDVKCKSFHPADRGGDLYLGGYEYTHIHTNRKKQFSYLIDSMVRTNPQERPKILATIAELDYNLNMIREDVIMEQTDERPTAMCWINDDTTVWCIRDDRSMTMNNEKRNRFYSHYIKMYGGANKNRNIWTTKLYAPYPQFYGGKMFQCGKFIFMAGGSKENIYVFKFDLNGNLLSNDTIVRKSSGGYFNVVKAIQENKYLLLYTEYADDKKPSIKYRYLE